MILLRIGVNIFIPGFNFLQKIFPHKRIGKKINNAFLGNSCNTQFVPDLVGMLSMQREEHRQPSTQLPIFGR